jgi:hypothetical protein
LQEVFILCSHKVWFIGELHFKHDLWAGCITSLNNVCRNGAGRPAGTFRRQKAMTGPNQQVAMVTHNSNLVLIVNDILFALKLSCTVQTLYLSIVCLPYNDVH